MSLLTGFGDDLLGLVDLVDVVLELSIFILITEGLVLVVAIEILVVNFLSLVVGGASGSETCLLGHIVVACIISFLLNLVVDIMLNGQQVLKLLLWVFHNLGRFFGLKSWALTCLLGWALSSSGNWRFALSSILASVGYDLLRRLRFLFTLGAASSPGSLGNGFEILVDELELTGVAAVGYFISFTVGFGGAFTINAAGYLGCWLAAT